MARTDERIPGRSTGVVDTVRGSLVTATPRTRRGILQLGLATLGVLVILGSLVAFAITLSAMTLSESGFAEGLAILVYGVYVLVGFVVLAVGLLIPQNDGDGIQFSPRQRKLLGYGAVAPVASVLAIPIGATVVPPLAGSVHSLLVSGLVGLFLSGPLATMLAVWSKLREWID